MSPGRLAFIIIVVVVTVAVVVTLAVVALIASFLPARRVTRIDPVAALATD